MIELCDNPCIVSRPLGIMAKEGSPLHIRYFADFVRALVVVVAVARSMEDYLLDLVVDF